MDRDIEKALTGESLQVLASQANILTRTIKNDKSHESSLWSIWQPVSLFISEWLQLQPPLPEACGDHHDKNAPDNDHFEMSWGEDTSP